MFCKDGLPKVALEYDFLYYQKRWTNSLDGKWKIVFLKKVTKNIIISDYLAIIVFLFSKNMVLSCQKSYDGPFSKDTLEICNINEKDDIYPRRYGIYPDRKMKDDKKFWSVKYTKGELVIRRARLI